MAEKLFSLLRKERERLELEIAIIEANGRASQHEIRRLKALHRAVNEQIGCWMRDLHGNETDCLRRAA